MSKDYTRLTVYLKERQERIIKDYDAELDLGNTSATARLIIDQWAHYSGRADVNPDGIQAQPTS